MTSNRFRINGLSPECVDHEWTGCGWGDVGRGRVYSDYQSFIMERQMNRDPNLGEWIAWRVEA